MFRQTLDTPCACARKQRKKLIFRLSVEGLTSYTQFNFLIELSFNQNIVYIIYMDVRYKCDK